MSKFMTDENDSHLEKIDPKMTKIKKLLEAAKIPENIQIKKGGLLPPLLRKIKNLFHIF